MNSTEWLLSDFRAHANAGMGKQIIGFLRDGILTGRFPSGARLPATAALARRWGTHVPTVQAAMSQLVKEGLLDRTPGKGTRVRPISKRLTKVGVYLSTMEPANRVGEVWRELALEVQHALSSAGIEVRVWSDPRSRAEQDTPLPELAEACFIRQIQGLVTFPVDLPKIKWLCKLPVPVAYFSSADLPGRVNPNHVQFFADSLGHLKRQGCRSVGLISAVATNDSRSPNRSPIEFYNFFLDTVGDLGLETHSRWIHALPSDGASTRMPAAYERHGYESFRRLWETSPRPDGLIVYEDAISRGAIQGALAVGAQPPEDMKFVLYRHREMGLHCPLTAAFMELSLFEVAQALIEQLRKQVCGETCQPVYVDYRLVATDPVSAPTSTTSPEAFQSVRREET